MNFLQFSKESFVLGDLYEPRLARELKHADWVMFGPVPELPIEMAKVPAGRGFPGPPEIEEHLAQRLERGRQGGDHVIGVIGRHEEAGRRMSQEKILAAG